MDADDKTIGHIYSRRETLQRVGAAGITLLGGGLISKAAPLVVPSQDGITISKQPMVASPALTQGPFFVEEHLNRSDITAGTTRNSVVNGHPLLLNVRLWELSGNKGTPLKGATVDVWHTCALGVYSDEPNGGNNENTVGQKWLRGYQVSDKSGLAEFKTIWPGWYPGRTIHIHFKVRIPVGQNTYDFTSQFFMTDAQSDPIMATSPYNTRGNRGTRNTNDGIYRTRQADNSFAGDHLLLTVTNNPNGGKIGRFDVAFDMDGL